MGSYCCKFLRSSSIPRNVSIIRIIIIKIIFITNSSIIIAIMITSTRSSIMSKITITVTIGVSIKIISITVDVSICMSSRGPPNMLT